MSEVPTELSEKFKNESMCEAPQICKNVSKIDDIFFDNMFWLREMQRAPTLVGIRMLIAIIVAGSIATSAVSVVSIAKIVVEMTKRK